MFTLKQLVVLALAGTTFAAPAAHRREDIQEHYAGRMEGTQWFDAKTGYPSFSGSSTTGDDTTTTVVVYGSGSSSTPAASASTGTTTTTTGSSGSDTGYMAVVNKWRSAGGLKALTQSSKLEGNALKTAQDGNGKMVHELNSGSMAQVLAPGSASDFEKVYVGGWLCEVPSLAGLNGICNTMDAGWDHSNGETGHADILTSKSYSNIGCALANGIWACDLS